MMKIYSLLWQGQNLSSVERSEINVTVDGNVCEDRNFDTSNDNIDLVRKKIQSIYYMRINFTFNYATLSSTFVSHLIILRKGKTLLILL